jgi:uncharacterized protein
LKIFKILIIAGIVFVAATIIYFMVLREDKKTTTPLTVEKRRVEPEFRQDGKLFFISSITLDTLSRLAIEIVEEPQEIKQGLMFRSTIEPDQGMFFIFDREEEQIFWMKNTRIPLDIVFADGNLTIVHIARYTVPYSNEPIMSMIPSKYVVEVRAGYCDEHGINISDLVRYDVLEPEINPLQ